MNELLQVIGSVASILGVPLAVYLYLKGQVQKYTNVRREIVKRLSHQIGEGRKIGLFELTAVIDSLVRENRLRSRSISPNSVVEDLIAETVSSPLLESARKEHLIIELAEVHSLGRMYQAIASDDAVYQKFIGQLEADTERHDEADEFRNRIEEAKENSSESSKLPELFGVISSGIAILVAAIAAFGPKGSLQQMPRLLDSDILTSLLLGVGVSLVAALISGATLAVISKRKSQ